MLLLLSTNLCNIQYHKVRTVLDLREFMSLQCQKLSTDFKINVLCILSVTGASLVFRDFETVRISG